MSSIKRYSDLERLETFEERFDYLSLGGRVGISTFGFDRHIGQKFYTSRQWRQAREAVIVRDNGCDLGIEGHEINTLVLIHHMNPMTPEDIIHGEDWILNTDFLITTTKNTHNAIHYGDKSLLPAQFVERKPGDTKLW